jgi:NAD(P)-dependent dehydrogenase (short-subunit alcohol dehydrogenase family)
VTPPSTAGPTDFAGKAVVITGAGRRGQVGECVAQAFGARGATLLLIDRDAAAVEERVADLGSLGVGAHGLPCDLTDPAAVAGVVLRADALAPNGVHALVNLAGGFAPFGPVGASEPAVWHRLIAINLTTAYVATRAFLPMVRRARGTIIYFASAAALPGAAVAELSAYSAAKGGVITLMRAIAAEEREAGIRANALAPTNIRTAANLESMGDNARYVERETIAAWVVWLASPDSGPVTAQVIKLG